MMSNCLHIVQCLEGDGLQAICPTVTSLVSCWTSFSNLTRCQISGIPRHFSCMQRSRCCNVHVVHFLASLFGGVLPLNMSQHDPEHDLHASYRLRLS